MNWIAGLVFGLIVGALMRAPGAEYFVAASAINLAVMVSLWLGLALAPGQSMKTLQLEVIVAIIGFILTALVFQHSIAWLYVGFAFQASWSFLHIDNRLGAASRPWFPQFAVTANVGLGLAAYGVLNLS